MLTSGEGKYRIWLQQKKIGDDLVYFLGGGEKPHIGCVVVCEPGKKTEITKFQGHYDHIVLKPIAEAACKKYKVKVVAIGGIHVDNATKEDINILVGNSLCLIKKI